MSTIVKIDNKYHLYIKGASELILKTCNKIHNIKTNEIKDINEHTNQEIKKAIFSMA